MKSNGVITFKQEREEFERGLARQEKIAEHQKIVTKWRSEAPARKRKRDAEIQRLKAVLVLERSGDFHPITFVNHGNLDAETITRNIHKSYATFLANDGSQLNEKDKKFLLEFLHNYPSADLTLPATFAAAQQFIEQTLAIPEEVEPVFQEDEQPAEQQPEPEGPAPTAEYVLGNAFRQVFVNVVADGTEWPEATMRSLFDRFSRSRQELTASNLRRFVINLYSPEYVDHPTSQEIAEWNDEREDRNLSAAELRAKYNQKGWR